MFCHLVRIYRSVREVIIRSAAIVALRIEQRLRQTWRGHGARVRSNATYAAVTATVLAGVLGMVPVTDVLSAVLGALLGVYASDRRRRPASGSWNDAWA